MESWATTDVSDYIAALKRRRKMLAFIMLPIAAVGVFAGAWGGVTGQVTPLELAHRVLAGGNLRRAAQPGPAREEFYADRYVSSLTDAVLVTDNLKKELKQPGVPAQLKQGDVEDIIGDIKHGTDGRPCACRCSIQTRAASARSCSPSASLFESRDPEMAHDVAAWVTTAFLKASRAHPARAGPGRPPSSIRQEADRYSKQIGTLESKLADFKAQNFGQLPELADVNLNVMDRTERELENIEMQLTNLRQNRIFLTRQLDQARTASPDATLLTQLQSEYAREQVIYDPDHPDLINLRRQIESLQRGGPAMSDMSLPAQLEAQKAILFS